MNTDPDVIKSCTLWYNNVERETCEYVLDAIRRQLGNTPVDFSSWNPSVGTNCEGWKDPLSYCIDTQEKEDQWEKDHPKTTTTSRSTATPTTSTTSLGPSPTAWKALGCYDDYPDYPVLEENMSPTAGDAALKIPNCQNACYRAAYTYAGVKEGNQCWCGDDVGGLYAQNQTLCNIPCTGDKSTNCGGQERLSVFEPEANKGGVPSASPTTTTVPTAASPPVSGSTSKASSVRSTILRGVFCLTFIVLTFDVVCKHAQ